MTANLTTIILTYNEEQHIERAIASVKKISENIIIVDSFSTDRTVELAESSGAIVFQNPFSNQAQQFQWGLDNAPIEAEWILRLDADEIIEDDLAENIQTIIPTLKSDIVGINLKRKHIFMDRWVKRGGRYPLTMLRIFRRGQGRVEQRWMDEHIVIEDGSTITLEGGFSDWNLNDLTYFVEKHNKYATREAVDVLNKRYGLSEFGSIMNAKGASKKVFLKRLIKEHIYNRLPFWLGPMIYFMHRYIIQLGFLDGRTGLIYHFLQGFWYRFLVGAKVLEFDRILVQLETTQEKREKLAELTGLSL